LHTYIACNPNQLLPTLAHSIAAAARLATILMPDLLLPLAALHVVLLRMRVCV